VMAAHDGGLVTFGTDLREAYGNLIRWRNGVVE
jgi:hypothetical protein